MKKIITYIIGIFAAGMFLFAIVSPQNEISTSERRKLQQFPKISLETILSGEFMEEFEMYAAEQFPLREKWRRIKAAIVLNVFNQSDNNELYVSDNHAVKIEYPLNEKAVQRAADLFQKIQTDYLSGKNCNAYYSMIPDKNYFSGDEYLRMDYEKMFSILEENLQEMTYIDIVGLLELEDYYNTDPHWKQECLIDVAEKIGQEMGAMIETSYQVQTLDAPFYGSYYGQAALPLEPDKLQYLTNAHLNRCTVYNFENQKETKIYDMEKANGLDPYELFLSGSISLLEIQNPDAKTGKKLVIFRDSFGSAVAPLLIKEYETITLIDIRYISSSYAAQLVDFENADVLFLYSTSVLNNSETLR